MKTSAIVVGGGIVGVCNALALRQAGHQVTLIDRKQPGRETSYGNAGVLSESSIMVLNNPNMLRALQNSCSENRSAFAIQQHLC